MPPVASGVLGRPGVIRLTGGLWATVIPRILLRNLM